MFFFYIRTGALRARLVRLVQPAKVEKIRGLVKSFKETFGFIERADVVGDVSKMNYYSTFTCTCIILHCMYMYLFCIYCTCTTVYTVLLQYTLYCYCTVLF